METAPGCWRGEDWFGTGETLTYNFTLGKEFPMVSSLRGEVSTGVISGEKDGFFVFLMKEKDSGAISEFKVKKYLSNIILNKYVKLLIIFSSLWTRPGCGAPGACRPAGRAAHCRSSGRGTGWAVGGSSPGPRPGPPCWTVSVSTPAPSWSSSL